MKNILESVLTTIYGFVIIVVGLTILGAVVWLMTLISGWLILLAVILGFSHMVGDSYKAAVRGKDEDAEM